MLLGIWQDTTTQPPPAREYESYKIHHNPLNYERVYYILKYTVFQNVFANTSEYNDPPGISSGGSLPFCAYDSGGSLFRS